MGSDRFTVSCVSHYSITWEKFHCLKKSPMLHLFNTPLESKPVATTDMLNASIVSPFQNVK